jgi:hypothetical protein
LSAVLASPSCEHCDDKRQVWNQWRERWIRCPRCTTRPKRRRDAEEMKTLLTGISARDAVRAERERMRRVVFAIMDTFKFPSLPNELVPTDRILQRWAAFGSGLPSENPDDYREARPPPLDGPTQCAVNDALALCAPATLALMKDWYKWKASITQLAERRHLSRRQLGREWRANLQVVRFKFLASPHQDLVKLARFVP